MSCPVLRLVRKGVPMAKTTQTWENVYVFISSTFNDMHAERDYLVKRVFPELSEWCEARKLRLVDIDLRWGVTEKDAQENKRVVEVCLANIDRCRPLFLCFLGQRRGWVPERDDIAASTFDAFPKLDEYLGSSVTEMEITHALIDPMLNGSVLELQNRERAFFFLRDPEYLDAIRNRDIRNVYTNEGEASPETADYHLEQLKDRVRETGRPTFNYVATWNESATTPELLAPGKPTGIDRGRLTDFKCDDRELADVVIEQVKGALEELYPERAPVEASTPLQRELDEQARFLQFAQEGFIERAGDFDDIERFIEDDDGRPCAIAAPAGMGKTSYLARLIDHLQNDATRNVMFRFIGTSGESVSQGSLLSSLAAELSSRFGVEGVPSAPQKIKEALPALLARAATDKPLVVVIDAINQLDTALDDLSWIPAFTPDGVTFIYSFKLGDAAGDALCQALQDDGGTHVMLVKGFQDATDRAALVNQYLSLYLKELDEGNIADIVSSAGADNPLFLKILLSELRVFGSHEKLHDMIAGRFGATPQTAFDAVLERLETDPMYSEVNAHDLAVNLFGWLSHSKNGLEPRELAGLLAHAGLAAGDDARDSVNLMLRQLRPFLAKRDKRQDFFYESFLTAARARYTQPAHGGKPDSEWHREMAAYFQALPDEDDRKTFELAYQYAHAGMGAALISLLTSFEYLERRSLLSGVQELVQDYALAELPQAGLSEHERQQLSLIREALELATPIVAGAPSQLAGQLFGRLMGFSLPLVWRLLDDADQTLAARKQPWLKPLCTHLPQPGGRVIRHYNTSAKCDVGLYRDNARMVLYASDDQTVRIVEIDSGRVLRSFPLTADPLWICLCEDENVLAIRHMSRLSFLDLTTGRTYTAADVAGVGSARFDAWNGLLVCTGKEPEGNTATVYVVDVKTGALVHRFAYRDDAPQTGVRNAFAAAFDPETGLLFMSIEDVGFTAYDPRDGFSLVRAFRNPDCESEQATARANKLFLPSGTPYLVTATEYDGLTIYDKHTGRVLAHRPAFNVAGTCVAVSPDGTALAHASFCRVELLSLDTFETTCRIDAGNARNQIQSLAFSSDGASLYLGRADGAIEAWDIASGQMVDALTETKGSAFALHLDTRNNTMVSQHSSQIVVWKQHRATIEPDSSVFDLPVSSATLSPDGTFIIATTLASDGAIYRIEVPSMECRRIVESNESFFAYKNAVLTCDSKYFGVTQRHNEFKVFDAETGELAGEFSAIDALQTNDIDSQWITRPRFLPASLSLGPRNLTVLYEQGGFLVMQDPDAPDATTSIDAFPGSIGWSRLFDGDTKIAMHSSCHAFDPTGLNLKWRDNPSLPNEAKVVDLASGACVKHTDDLWGVYLDSLEIDDCPSAVKLVHEAAAQSGAQGRFGQPFKIISHQPGRLLFDRNPLPRDLDGETWSMTPFVVWDSTREKPLCSYMGRWNTLISSDDGRYVFLTDNDTLHPFSLENLPEPAKPLKSESELDHLGLVLFEKGDMESMHESYLVYSELVERFPGKEHHVKNRGIVERKLKTKLDEMSKANDVAGIERYYDVYRELADGHPGDESRLALLNYAQGKLAFRLSIRDDLASKERACKLYADLVERHYDEERNRKNLHITQDQIAKLQSS